MAKSKTGTDWSKYVKGGSGGQPASPQARKQKRPQRGNVLARFANDLGNVVSAPLFHTEEFVKGFANDLSRTTGVRLQEIKPGKIAGENIGREIAAASATPGLGPPSPQVDASITIPKVWTPPVGVAQLEKAVKTRDVGAGVRALSNLPTAYLPGVRTAGQLTTPEGREEIVEHPGYAALDVLPLVNKILPPGLRAAGLPRAAAVAEHPISATAKAGVAVTKSGVRQLAKTERGAAVLHRAEQAIQPALEVLPSKRARAVKAAAVNRRILDQNLDELQKAQVPAFGRLTEPERLELGKHLEGATPLEKVPENLREAYVTYQKTMGAAAETAAAAQIPAELHGFLKSRAVASQFDDLAKTHGPEVAQQVAVAFRTGLENPFPKGAAVDASKSWTKIRDAYRKGLEQEVTKYRVGIEEVPGVGEATPGGFREVKRTQYGRVAPEYAANTIHGYRAYAPDGKSLGSFRTKAEAEAALPPPRVVVERVPVPERASTTEVFSVKQSRDVRRALKQYDAGKITQEEMQAVIDANVPAAYRPALAPFEEARKELRRRRNHEKGFGQVQYKKAMTQLLDDMDSTWTEVAAKGVRPSYLPRVPVEKYVEMQDHFLFPRTLKPGQPAHFKTPKKILGDYVEDPIQALNVYQYRILQEHLAGKTVGQIFDTAGGMTWGEAFQTMKGRGAGVTDDLAGRMVKNHYRSLDVNGQVGPAREGAVLIHRDIARSLQMYLDPQKFGWLDKALGVWMVPTLHLAPRFHVNNIIGGAVITANKTTPVALIKHLKEGAKMSWEGKLDPRIPGGGVMEPMYRQLHIGPLARELEGQSIARVVLQNIRHPIRFSQKMNSFFDQMYKSVAYLYGKDKALRKGLTLPEAEANGVRVASELMQDWDSMSVFERQVVQRLMPFWGWRRVMLRYVYNLPREHPFRMAFQSWVVSNYEQQQQDSRLPDSYENLVAISGQPGENQLFVSMRGVNPFADLGDLFTLKGFLGQFTPFIQQPLRALGVDTYTGGVSPYVEMEFDTETGRRRGRVDWGELVGFFPQLKSTPPPKDTSLKGWKLWLAQNDTRLGLPFPLSEHNVDEVARRMQREWSSTERDRRRRERQEQRESGAPSTTGTDWGAYVK